MTNGIGEIELKGVGKFYAAQRSEMLGGRIRWCLFTRDAALEHVVAALRMPDKVGVPGPQVAGPLTFDLVQPSATVTVNGPFRICSCDARLNDGGQRSAKVYEVTLEQTVEEPDASANKGTQDDHGHLQSRRSAKYLPDGDFYGWLRSSPIASLLSSVDQQVQDAINKAFGATETVILQIDQSAVDLAAWLAWAVTQATKESDLPFWIIGEPGKTWRLVQDDDDPKKKDVEAGQQVLQAGPSRKMDTLYDAPYLRLDCRVTSFSFTQDRFDDKAIENRVTGTYLPKRIEIGGQDRWVVDRHDTWNTGYPAWRVELLVADRAPMPAWTPPSLLPAGRLLGEVAESWSRGPSVMCTMDHCPDKFPVRLTTFDAGSGSVAGWQWVPTKKNIIVIDPDWSLTGLPAIRYIERHNSIGEPYTTQLPAGKRWLTKFGDLILQLFEKGGRIG